MSEAGGLQGAEVLVVDDQAENIDVVLEMLAPEGYEMLVARSGERGLEQARRSHPELVLLDVMMPGIDGYEVCRQLKADEQTREIPVIFLTARTDPEDIDTAFRVGVVDYISKPFHREELCQRVATHLRLRRSLQTMREQNEALHNEIARREALAQERDHLAGHLSLLSDEEHKRWGLEGFVGQSTTLKKILTEVGRLQQTSVSVLIHGESGTGKELVARAIHSGSERKDRPFVPVNCSAVPHELADSLFFGHTKGAFTGATGDKPGYFRLAEGGTLFLDEIGDMPLDMQAKLLRVLEERKVLPVGGEREVEIDVRVLSATHVDMQEAVRAGRFRQDLYYRLAGFPVSVPALRERREDIPLLAQHFLQMLAAEMGARAEVGEAALEALLAYDFPGNIRELKNIVERALIESGGAEIKPQHLHLDSAVAPAAAEAVGPSIDHLPLNLAKAEIAIIQKALSQTEGNMVQAAKLLGISRAKLYRRLAQVAGDEQE